MAQKTPAAYRGPAYWAVLLADNRGQEKMRLHLFVVAIDTFLTKLM